MNILYLYLWGRVRFGRWKFGRRDYRAPELFFYIHFSVATLFRFVARFARVRIENSSRNRFTLNGMKEFCSLEEMHYHN